MITFDSNILFLWHESVDIDKQSLTSKNQLIPNVRLQVIHDYVFFNAP